MGNDVAQTGGSSFLSHFWIKLKNLVEQGKSWWNRIRILQSNSSGHQLLAEQATSATQCLCDPQQQLLEASRPNVALALCYPAHPFLFGSILRGYMLFFINQACALYNAFDKCLYICDVVQ